MHSIMCRKDLVKKHLRKNLGTWVRTTTISVLVLQGPTSRSTDLTNTMLRRYCVRKSSIREKVEGLILRWPK
jgi:hypothetical protein